MSGFLKRHPGVKRTLIRGAFIGAIGGGLAAAGFRNRRSVRMLLQHELPIIRARRSVAAYPLVLGKAEWNAQTVRRMKDYIQKGRPQYAEQVRRMRAGHEPVGSEGLRSLLRSFEKDTRRLKKHARGLSRRSVRQMWGAGGVGTVGGAWAAMPAAEALDRHRERRAVTRESGAQIFLKHRRAA